MKRVFICSSIFIATTNLFAESNYNYSLYGKVTDFGEVINKLVIDYTDIQEIKEIDKDTFTVNAKAYVQAGSEKGNLSYDINREIVKIDIKENEVILYFNEAEGKTMTYLPEKRNFPAKLEYSIKQNKAIKAKK